MPRSDSPLRWVWEAAQRGQLSAGGALLTAQQALAEDAEGRRVAAHSNAHVMDRIATALGQGPGDESDDEYAQLFNPASPLGHQTQDAPSTHTPGDSGPKPRRKRQPETAASVPPLTDAQLHAALFGDSFYEDRPVLGPVE